MDFVQLKTFIAIVDKGSFSHAAESLNSVQSNITARIRRLEEHVGGRLFERSKNGAVMTALGRQLEPMARDVLARLASTEASMLEQAGGCAPLRLGALESTASSRLPDVLCILHKRFPTAEITLQTGSSGVLTQRVWQRELDAALVVGQVDPDRFDSIPAFEEKLVEVRQRAARPVNTLLAFGQGCGYRAAAVSWLSTFGKGDVTIREYGSLETILGCVGAGLGFAVAPEYAVERSRYAALLQLTPLQAEYRRSTTSLIWRNDTKPTKTILALKEALAES